MKKIKQLKGRGIYELNEKEKKEFNFSIAVIHPDNMEYTNKMPADTDIELETVEQAISWIKNY